MRTEPASFIKHLFCKVIPKQFEDVCVLEDQNKREALCVGGQVRFLFMNDQTRNKEQTMAHEADNNVIENVVQMLLCEHGLSPWRMRCG